MDGTEHKARPSCGEGMGDYYEEERSRVIQSLIELKNNLAAQGRYTDAVDDVLCKVLGAKKKKLKIEYI